MKKKIILLTSLFFVLITFTACKTKEPEREPFPAEKVKQKINAYMFWGDGCQHCESAHKFFKTIEKEYANCYQLVDFETWKSQEHRPLMDKVAKHFEIEEAGVPLIIIGDTHYSGYAESLNNQIIQSLIDSCAGDDYKDIVKEKQDELAKEAEKAEEAAKKSSTKKK